MKIGIIGFGMMGSSLYKASIEAGHQTTVFVKDALEKEYLDKMDIESFISLDKVQLVDIGKSFLSYYIHIYHQ